MMYGEKRNAGTRLLFRIFFATDSMVVFKIQAKMRTESEIEIRQIAKRQASCASWAFVSEHRKGHFWNSSRNIEKLTHLKKDLHNV